MDAHNSVTPLKDRIVNSEGMTSLIRREGGLGIPAGDRLATMDQGGNGRWWCVSGFLMVTIYYTLQNQRCEETGKKDREIDIAAVKRLEM